VILWTLSADFTIPGTEIAVPGFLFWVALIYSIVGTLITHVIGRSLVALVRGEQSVLARRRSSWRGTVMAWADRNEPLRFERCSA
jgi:putative ATP-binding cassette transporter